MAHKRRKVAIGSLLLVVALALAAVVFLFSLRNPLPAGEPGPRAEQLVDEMLRATNQAAWDEVGAVTWSWGGRPQVVWDRRRGRAQVGEGASYALLDLSTKRGVVVQGGETRSDEDALARAYADFINDSFWLNPLPSLRAPGNTLGYVALDDGREGVLVTYNSGGVTPGDAYLWIVDDKGQPAAWRMWTSLIPIGGMEMSWEGWWAPLAGGTKLAVEHRALGLTRKLENLHAARTLEELGVGALLDTLDGAASRPAE